MTIVRTEDNRNIEWRKNNVGANLLQKMGWKEGEGIGKRGTSSTTALRALKRQAGLGLGAKMANEGGQSESTNHFSTVLKNLQAHHAPTTTSKKSKKKKKKNDERVSSSPSSERTNNSSSLVLPQNKVVAGHAKKRRNAKFGEKSAEDLACIFGNSGAVFEPVPVMKESSEKSGSEEKEPSSSKKRSNSHDSEEKREKKRRKKEKKEKRKKKET